MNANATYLVTVIGMVLTVMVISFSLMRVYHMRRWEQQQRRLGIFISRQLRHLIADIQQHRGMVSAYLNGDARFKPRIHQKQKSINDDFANLQRQQASDLMTPTRWERIQARWTSLSQTSLKETVANSFELHSELIRQMLFLMGDVAERSHLQADDASEATMVEMVWTRIPAVAESIGQARAVGAGVAAAGHCSSVQRIKLRYLRGKVFDIMGKLAADNPSGAVSLSPQTQQSVHLFLTELEDKILASERPMIQADVYFALATDALDAVFAIFDEASDRMEQRIGGVPVVATRQGIGGLRTAVRGV